MRKLLFIGLSLLLVGLSSIAQDIGVERPFRKYEKSSRKTFEPSFTFNRKYIPGEAVSLPVIVEWNEGMLMGADLIFPEGTVINSAGDFGGGFYTAAASIDGTKIIWESSFGIPASFAPQSMYINVTLPANASGNLELTSVFRSDADTVETISTLVQLGEDPKLVVSMAKWDAGISQVSNTVYSNGVYLFNDGLNDLIISGVSSTDTIFNVISDFPRTVEAQKLETFLTKFYSEDYGIFSDVITIESNGGNVDLAVEGAAYDENFNLFDFENASIQFPYPGWVIDDYGVGGSWYMSWGVAKIDDNDNGGADSAAFILPPVDLSNSANKFLGFTVQRYGSHVGHIDVEYSTDNKQTWNMLVEGVTDGTGQNGEFYTSLEHITASEVIFKIKGVAEYGNIGIDNIVLPNYSDLGLVPEPVSVFTPIDSSDNVTTATDFFWEKVLYADGYRFYLDTLPDPVKFYEVGDTTRFSADLESFTKYYWKVVPYNKEGDAVDCPVWTFKTEQFLPTQWTTDTYKNTKLTHKNTVKYQPKITATDMAETYVVWREIEDGNANMKMQLIDSSGAEMLRRGGVHISKHPQASYFSDYGILADNDGNLITAMIDIRNTPDSDDPRFDAFVYKTNKQGEMLWGVNGIALNDGLYGDVFNTEVQKDDLGNIYVGFIPTATDYQVIKFDTNGDRVWDNPLTIGGAKNWKVMPNGEIYTLFTDGSTFYLNLLKSDKTSKFTKPVPVCNDFYDIGNPQLEVDKNNGVYVVWGDLRMTTQFVSWQYVKPDQSIALDSAGQEVSINEGRSQNYHKTVYDEANDKLIVIWDEKYGNYTGLYLQRFDNTGGAEFGETGKAVVELTDTIAGSESILIRDNKIIWHFSSFLSGFYYQNFLNAMYLDMDCNIIPEIGTIRYSSNHTHKPLRDMQAASELMVMTWKETREDEGEQVYVQNLYFDGSMGYRGEDTLPPYAEKIDVLSNEKLLLTFNEEVIRSAAQNINNYYFEDKSVSITKASMVELNQIELVANGLGFGMQKMYIKNASDLLGNVNILDSIQFEFSFDTVYPYVINSKPVDVNKIVVEFNESIVDSLLTDTANYTIDGLNIYDIVVINSERIVLYTDELPEGEFSLSIKDLIDKRENNSKDIECALSYSKNTEDNYYFTEDFEDGMPETFALYDLDKANPIFREFDKAWIGIQEIDGTKLAASTSYYDPVAKADDWMVLPKTYIQKGTYLMWDASAFSHVLADGYEVWVSTTGNTPEDFDIKVFEIFEEHYITKYRYVDLSDFGFGNEAVYVAFRNNSNSKYILGVDNIDLYTPHKLDLNVYAHNIPEKVLGGSALDIKVDIKSVGINNITAFNYNWQLNNGEIHTQEITDIELQLREGFSLTHDAKLDVPSNQGTYELKIWTSMPNGMEDENTANDTIYAQFFVSEGYAQSLVLIEHFTNTGCGPCAEQNPELDALLAEGDNHDKVVHVSYHVWWPGDDHFYNYNMKEAYYRNNYYGITSVPTVTVNGGQLLSPNQVTQDMITEEYVKSGLISINGESNYMLSNDSIKLDVEMVNLADFDATNMRMFAVLNQTFDYESAPGGNGETHFPGVMRKIIPSHEGELISKLDSGNVNSFSYEFELSDEFVKEDASVAVFVQNVNTREVLMATKYDISESYVLSFALTVDGVAVSDVAININGTNYISDNDGFVAVKYKANGTYTYRINDEIYSMVEGTIEIAGADEHLDIELTPVGAEVNGFVSLEVYPNPANKQINIVANTDIETVTICNASGKEIINIPVHAIATQLSVDNMQPGFYYLKIRTQSGDHIEKIIIQR